MNWPRPSGVMSSRPQSPLMWVMKPTTAYRTAATIGSTATVDIPRTLFGIPLVLSSTSPPQITLLDPHQVLYSDDGAIASR